jgi:HD-like signal output (HDOD) protein
MRMLDDPRVSAETLGRVVEADPALSVQMIRLANTSYYGLAEPVGSAWRAITVIGISTVRSVVTTAAFDLFDGDAPLPAGYWRTALATAAAAGAIAGRVGLQPGDAFSAGLLQDIGRALLARRARDTHERIDQQVVCPMQRVHIEREVLGFTHADITANALEALRFPPATVEATRQHHGDPESIDSPMGKVLHAADLVALKVGNDRVDSAPITEALALLDIREEAEEIVLETANEVESLSVFLTVGA